MQQEKIEKPARSMDNNEEAAPMGHSRMLVPCKKCGRRFLDNRVAKHEEHCQGKAKKDAVKENMA
jgi:hypothetical protein